MASTTRGKIPVRGSRFRISAGVRVVGMVAAISFTRIRWAPGSPARRPKERHWQDIRHPRAGASRISQARRCLRSVAEPQPAVTTHSEVVSSHWLPGVHIAVTLTYGDCGETPRAIHCERAYPAHSQRSSTNCQRRSVKVASTAAVSLSAVYACRMAARAKHAGGAGKSCESSGLSTIWNRSSNSS